MSSILDALEYAGSVLDKPGRAVRGLLAGRPGEGLAALPLSDTLGLTDPSQRVSGRDLLSQYGLGSGDDTLDSILGFGAEIATDPTNLLGLGLGAKAAGNVGRLGKAAMPVADAIASLKPEPLAAVSPGMLKRLQGLPLTPADFPRASEVAHLPPDLTEAVIRSRVGGRQMADDAARSLPPMEFDPAHFPAVPDPVPELPHFDPDRPPSFSNYAPWLGDPANPSAPSLINDMLLDERPLQEMHRAAAMHWDEALSGLEGVNREAIVADPEWKHALLNRLIELSGAKDYGHILPMPADLAPTVESQLDQIHNLLGFGPEGYRSMGMRIGQDGYVLGAGDLNRHQLRFTAKTELPLESAHAVGELRDLNYGAWEPQKLAPGSQMADLLTGPTVNPLLRPDLDAARKIAGRREATDAADYIRQMAAAQLGGDEFYPEHIAEVLAGRHKDFPGYAIKGAIRTDPQAAEAASLLREYLQRLAQQPG
jgi:hypothetical protein